MTHSQMFQLATYAKLLSEASGLVQITTMVKTKTPQVVSLDHRVTEADRRGVEIQYPLIQEAMKSGYYVPNRGSMLCSRRNCAFWQVCESEFRGKGRSLMAQECELREEGCEVVWPWTPITLQS